MGQGLRGKARGYKSQQKLVDVIICVPEKILISTKNLSRTHKVCFGRGGSISVGGDEGSFAGGCG